MTKKHTPVADDLDQPAIETIMENIFWKAGCVADEDYDGNPASPPELGEAAMKITGEIEEHLNALFSRLRSDARARREAADR